jgi:hypothetical protein
MVMNLAQAMLAARNSEAFLSERWAKESKNKTCKVNDQMEYTPQQVSDCAIFELSICPFDIQSGRRYAFERQREDTRRDL